MNINKVNEFLDLPREVGTNIPKITMMGFDEIIIENYILMMISYKKNKVNSQNKINN